MMVEICRNPPKFKISKIIGKGTFGKVFLAVNLETGEHVAIKRSFKWKRKMSREVGHLENCKECDNVMAMLDVFYTTTPKGFFVQNIICEYMECSLGHFIRKTREIRETDSFHRIPPHIVRNIARGVLQGISFLHSKKIAHRDLKPDNILIEKVNSITTVKISDLGSAKELNQDSPSMSYICSRWYRAPELLFGLDKYSVAVDLWSFGCILAELCTLQPIFNGRRPRRNVNQSNKQQPSKCGSDEPYQILCILEILGSPSEKAMNAFLSGVPENVKQAGFDEIGKLHIVPLSLSCLLEPFILPSNKSIVDLIELFLQWDPDSRISAKKGLYHEYFND